MTTQAISIVLILASMIDVHEPVFGSLIDYISCLENNSTYKLVTSGPPGQATTMPGADLFHGHIHDTSTPCCSFSRAARCKAKLP
jgi:hypothetical protein